MIGHFSSRYKELAPLLDEARTLSPERYPADRRGAPTPSKNDLSDADQSRHPTRPRAGRQTRPHRRTGFSSPKAEKLIGELRASHRSASAAYSALDGVFDGPEDVMTVAAARHGAALAAQNPDRLAGPRRDPPPQTSKPQSGCRTAGAGARRRAEPGRSGHDRPAGRLVRHHGACGPAPRPRPTVSTPRSYRPPWARSSACGSTTADLAAVLRPNAAALARPVCGTFLEGDEHLPQPQLTPAGIVADGQRGPRRHARLRRAGHAQTLHPALPRRAARHRIAQRGHGHGHRLRRIPPTGECRTARRPQAGTTAGRERSDLRSAALCRFVRIVVRATVRPGRHRKQQSALIPPRRLSAGPTKKVPPHRQDKTEKRKAEFYSGHRAHGGIGRLGSRSTPHHKPESHPRRNIRPLRSTTNTTLPFLRHSMQPLRLVPTFD